MLSGSERHSVGTMTTELSKPQDASTYESTLGARHVRPLQSHRKDAASSKQVEQDFSGLESVVQSQLRF